MGPARSSCGASAFQNAEAGEFLDTLVDAGELRFESVLVLHGGQVIVLLARTPPTW